MSGVRSRRLLLVVAGVAVLGAALWYALPRSPTRELRVGYFNFIPFLAVNADGSPGGFSVEVFAEAARREGVAIRWVNTEGSPDVAFADGRIDLYPMLAITDARRERLTFSRPWWENNLGLVTHADRVLDRSRLERGDVSVGVLDLSFGVTLFRKAFPRAGIEPFRAELPLVASVCEGTTDGAMVEPRTFNLIRERLRVCDGVPLRFTWFRELNLTYGVGARPGFERDAARLHRAIVALALDGTMTEIGERYGVQATNQMTLFRDLVAVRGRNALLAAAVGALGLLLAGFGWQNRRVRLARRAAEEASLAKNQFLASVSHEVRTPLNGVLGMTELLLGTRLDDSQREFVRALDTSGRALLGLIDDVLDFAKIESGRLTLSAEPYVLVDLVDDVVTLFAGRAAAGGLDIGACVDADVPPVLLGDAGRLRQVLANLVGNAVKFTDAGYVLLEVSYVQGGDPDAGSIRFAVTDSGIGIPDDQRDRLFQPFSQLDMSNRRRHGGTGLGLVISRELVTLMGGRIGVARAGSGGSVFWCEVPAVVPVDAEAVGEAAPPLGGIVHMRVDGEATRALVEATVRAAGATPHRLAGDADLATALRQGDRCVIASAAALDRVGMAVRVARDGSATGDSALVIRLTPIGEMGRAASVGHERAGVVSIALPVRQAALQRALRGEVMHPQGVDAETPADAPDEPLRARVLVADDNAINQRVVERMLERLGCEVTVVDNGRDAVQAALRGAFDLVLMDCQMPGMDGFDATRAIRASAAGAALPILALTATALPAIHAECHDAGMNGVLTKPCSIGTLRQAVRTWAVDALRPAG